MHKNVAIYCNVNCRESITGLTFSRSGLISASEDCTACLWDIVEGVIIRRFHHHKGNSYPFLHKTFYCESTIMLLAMIYNNIGCNEAFFF